MRWSLLIAVFGLSITDVASQERRPPDGQRLALTRSASEHAGFFASTGVVRFQLIQGRLCLDAPRHRKGCQNRDQDGLYESITVTAERGIPSMHYVCKTPDHHLTLSVQKADAVRIESWFPKTAERAVIEQPALGTITWTHTRADLKDQYDGATMLHVRQADAASFDLHYGLLFQRLLRGQSLAALTAATQVAMLQPQATASVPDKASIQDCVDSLRSKRRSRRIAAERELLSWGTPIIPVIQGLASEDLDVEQVSRLSHILGRLRPRVDDTPSTLAKLLVNDHAYWTSISTGLTSDQLGIANHHLDRFGAARLEQHSDPEQRIARASD
jgi:hypothetical protein